MLRITPESAARYEAAKRTEHQDLFGKHSRFALSTTDNLMLFGRREIQKQYGQLGIIKLPKAKTSDDTWYHLIHVNSGLVIGLVQSDQLAQSRKVFERCKWYYLASDLTRMTLVAVYGNNCRTIFNCMLRYEQVTDENTD